MIKRMMARIFLPLLTVWMMIVPAQSYAAVPLLLVGAELVADTGAPVIISNAATALTNFIGTTFLSLYFYSGLSSQKVVIPLGLGAIPSSPSVPDTLTRAHEEQIAVTVYTWRAQ